MAALVADELHSKSSLDLALLWMCVERSAYLSWLFLGASAGLLGALAG